MNAHTPICRSGHLLDALTARSYTLRKTGKVITICRTCEAAKKRQSRAHLRERIKKLRERCERAEERAREAEKRLAALQPSNLRAQLEAALDEVRDLRRLLKDDGNWLTRLDLQPRHRDVLAALAARPGIVVRADYLFETLWPEDANRKTMHVTVCHLRSRLRRYDAAIETVIGLGWRMTKEDVAKLKAVGA